MEITVDATFDNLGRVTEFVTGELEKLDCSMKAQMQIDIAIDEIFGNIARYAYNGAVGKATVRLETLSDPLRAVITFIDSGKRFDPLAKPDPDITLSAEERQIGGLGIYLVKKTMDDMTYEYKDGKNILKLIKTI